MTAPPSIAAALSAVMAEVQAVGKGDRNQQQGFSFRGVDSVVNAVGPALRKHGVVVVPTAVTPNFQEYESRQGARMRNAVLTITWRFYGPAGDFIEAQTLGEASDAGDKSVPKSHSVAYRTLLLQALCIPTDEPDPDAQSHERAQAAQANPARVQLSNEVRAAAKAASVDNVRDDYAQWSQGERIEDATLDQLEKYRDALRAQVSVSA